MGWATVYIDGRGGFEVAVLSKLKNSKLNGTSELNHKLLMFWLKDYSHLRDFKLSIGSQIIFKYRLRFFTDLEAHLVTEKAKTHIGFSVSEKKLIHTMETLERQRAKKYSCLEKKDLKPDCSYVSIQ